LLGKHKEMRRPRKVVEAKAAEKKRKRDERATT